MKNLNRWLAVALVGVFCSCESTEEPGFNIFSNTYDFSTDLHGWETGFTDYPASIDTQEDSSYLWKYEYTTLPPELGGKNAIMLSCDNRSGDVFMFIKKKIPGFLPDTEYTLVFEIELATNALSNQSVVLKAGATDVEPKKVIEGDQYSLNIDKGTQLTAGEDIVVLGNIGIEKPGSTGLGWVKKDNSSAYDPFIVKSNSKGEIWLIVGTDSGYLGVTTVYYSKVSVVFSASN